MKFRTATCLALLLVVALLGACSPQQPAAPTQPSPTPGPTPTPTSAPAPSPAPAPVKPAAPRVLNLSVASGTGLDLNMCEVMRGGPNPIQDLANAPLVLHDAYRAKVHPEVAESWEARGNSFVLKLRQNIKWHDGQPFTADDVVFSFHLWTRAAGPWFAATKGSLSKVSGFQEFVDGKATTIAGIKKVDGGTVAFELSEPPTAGWWASLQGARMAIVPRHKLEGVAPDKVCQNDFWTQGYVGTGPFRIVRYVEGQRIEMEANPDYWRGKPKIDRVIFHLFQSPEPALAAFEKGELDHAEVPVTSLDYVKALPNTKVVQVPGLVQRGIHVRVATPEFADRRVRHAMAHAIDRDAIIQDLYKGLGVKRPLPIFQEWAIPRDYPDYAYDPAKARQLLQDAGWTSSAEHVFGYYYSDKTSVAVMNLMQAQLAAVGIKTKPTFAEGAALTELQKTAPLVYVGNGLNTDPSVLGNRYSCAAVPPKGANYTMWCNPQFDDLLAKGARPLAEQERAPFYHQAVRVWMEDLPMVPIIEPSNIAVFKSFISGVKWGRFPLYTAIETWDLGK